jgi:Na+-driven multidrug efflux pump
MGFGNELLTDKQQLSAAFNWVNTIVNAIVGVMGGMMVLLAIYLAYKFMTADDEAKRKTAKGQMIYAIIGIIVVVLILVLWNTLLKNYLGSQTSQVNIT